MKQKNFYWVDPVSNPKYQPAPYECSWGKYEEAKRTMCELLSQRYHNYPIQYFRDRCVSASIDCEEFEHSTNAVCVVVSGDKHPLGAGTWNPVQRDDTEVEEYLYYTKNGLPVIAGIYDYDAEDNQFVLLVD